MLATRGDWNKMLASNMSMPDSNIICMYPNDKALAELFASHLPTHQANAHQRMQQNSGNCAELSSLDIVSALMARCFQSSVRSCSAVPAQWSVLKLCILPVPLDTRHTCCRGTSWSPSSWRGAWPWHRVKGQIIVRKPL